MEDPTTVPVPGSLDASFSSPSNTITPSSALLNMNDFTLDMTSPGPDTLLIPQSSAAKQPKKRKSWGQALPEPKTTLPPRKRAKTDDEKEQRRIERIKRNRAAAHNSRERKRVEAERLEVENHHLKHKLLSMQKHLLQQNAQLDKFQRLFPNALPQLSATEFATMTFDLPEIKDESDSDSPSSSTDTIDPRASLTASSPGDEDRTPFIKAESPSTTITMPSHSAPAPGSLDQTRHSAAMLCDLQCRSSQTLASTCWANMMLYLMHLNIIACYKTLLITFWTLFPARMRQAATLTASTLSQSKTSSTTTCSTTTSSSRHRRTTTTTTTKTARQCHQRRIKTMMPLPSTFTVPSATSTTPFSLPNSLSRPLRSQTSAQSFLAKGLQREGPSAQLYAALLRRFVELGNSGVELGRERDGSAAVVGSDSSSSSSSSSSLSSSLYQSSRQRRLRHPLEDEKDEDGRARES